MSETSERLRAALALASLIYMLAILWLLLVPAHTRARLKMRVLLIGQRAAAGAARRAGLAAMDHELATDRQDYELPLALSLVRERLAAAYEQARGAL